jgi:hypothetical protein
MALGSSATIAPFYPRAVSCKAVFTSSPRREAFAWGKAAIDNEAIPALLRDPVRASIQRNSVNRYFRIRNVNGFLIPAGAAMIVRHELGPGPYQDEINRIVGEAIDEMLRNLALDWDALQAVANKLAMKMPSSYRLGEARLYEQEYDGQRYFPPRSPKYLVNFVASRAALYWGNERRENRRAALIAKLREATLGEAAAVGQ